MAGGGGAARLGKAAARLAGGGAGVGVVAPSLLSLGTEERGHKKKS